MTIEYINLVLDHWPLFFLAGILGVCGIFADRMFTRARAYKLGARGVAIGVRWPWYWLRETKALHPILTGALLGFVLPLPDGDGTLAMRVLYYGGAGAIGLGVWIYLRGRIKKGEVKLPGLD